MSDETDVARSLILAVQDFAVKNGRAPIRAELGSLIKGAEYKLRGTFKTFNVLLQAAGLETYDERRGRKIDSSVFERDIGIHLEKYSPRLAPVTKALLPPTLPSLRTISDIHWPFVNDAVVSAFVSDVERSQPEWVILNGDAWDMYSHTKFPRSHNVFTPREEHEAARRLNAEFWAEVIRVAPKAKCVQMLGNHDIRPLKRVLESYPAAEDWIERMLQEAFTFDGVRTIHDYREELIINDAVMVFHGYRSQLGSHRDYTLFNTINGHTHVGGTVFRRIRGQTLWELNSGFAGDPESKGLSYTPQKTTNWTPGYGAVDELGPRFIPVG
jgi:predicted phosphodiesterase